MQKVYVVKSEAQLGKYRLVINITDETSTGIILTKNELNQLYYEVKNIIEENNLHQIDQNNS